MFKKLTIHETIGLLNAVGACARDSVDEISLGAYPKYYRIRGGYQTSVNGDVQDIVSSLAMTSIPAIPDDWKATVVLELSPGCPMSLLGAVYSWAEAGLGDNRLERFEPVYVYDGQDPFGAQITIVCHDAGKKRNYHSSINSQCRLLWDIDHRIAKTLDGELMRNEEVGTVMALDADTVCDMMVRSHFLWTAVTGSTRSVSDIVKRFRPEIERVKKEYSVSGLLLFVEVDRDQTTMGEIDALKQRLAKVAGDDVETALNVRIKDSYIKTISCRAVLIGSQRYVKGEVFVDFGQYEILLDESGDKESGHILVASYADGSLTISRYDWGDYERNARGETDDHHYFDEENTARLMTALNVRKPESLLRTIRRRFAARVPAAADSQLLSFCRKEGIKYTSDYRY